MIGKGGPRHPAELPAGWPRWAALAVFAALVAAGVLRHDAPLPAAVVAAMVSVAAAVMLVLRRGPLLGCAALATAGITVLGHDMASNVVWFAVCLLAMWCGFSGGRQDGLVFLAAALTLFAVQWIWLDHDYGWAAWIGGTTLSALAALLIRHQLDLVARLREAQAGLAEQARLAERDRIGRELHDVIAHTLTVALLHITSARLAVQHEPADAARALAEAERLSRESLDEVRLAVGMLHHRANEAGETGPGATAPLPGADGLPTLVERFRAAGADVTLAVDGDTARLHATTGLAVYRIAQEALTNAVKHAPGAAAAVRVSVTGAEVRLAVDSTGPPGTGTGLGLVSMRERAEALGGTCAAGPGGRGWLVSAALPLSADRRRESLT